MQVTLKAVAGPHDGTVFTFAEHDVFLVGRSKKAHFRLPKKDMYFSRVHFMVEVNPPRCHILDMGSRNGTHVNGKKISSSELHDGDKIQAGHTVLLVRLAEEQADEGSTYLSPGAHEKPANLESTLHWADAAPAPAPASGPPTRVPAPMPIRAKAICVICDQPTRISTELLCPYCQSLADAQPQTIPGHHLVKELGRGAMGIVHLAVCASDAARVAIKTIQPAIAGNPGQVQRFLREAEILKRLRHQHIVSFREMDEASGLLYFVMDHVQGSDLKDLLRKTGPMDVRLACRIVAQVLEALGHAHAQGFVHRDIKPANILVAEEEGKKSVKLADFGLARVYQASRLSGLTVSGDVGGTLPYLAPEQITNYRDVQPAADQYSTAATLYHILTDKFIYDFPVTTAACFLMVLENDPLPIRTRRVDVPKGLAATIHRALARDPAERFPSVTDFREELLLYAR